MLGLVLVGYFMTILGQAILDNEKRMRSKHQKRVTTALTKMAQQRFQSFDKFRSFFRCGLPASLSDSVSLPSGSQGSASRLSAVTSRIPSMSP
jgi:hypothetical protein